MSSEKTSKDKKRDYVANYKYTTSIHPLGMATSAPLKILKLLWVIAFVAAATMLIIQLTTLVVAYRKYPVQTKLAQVTRPIQQFPAVTFCNLNSLKRSKLKCTEMDGLAALDVQKGDLWNCGRDMRLPSDAYLDLEMQEFGSGSGDFLDYLDGELDSGSGSDRDYNTNYDYGSGNYSLGSGYGNDSVDYWDGSGSGMDFFDYGDWQEWSSGEMELGDIDIDGAFEMPPVSDIGLLKMFIRGIKNNKTSREIFANLVKQSKVSDFSDAKGIITVAEQQARRYGYTKDDMIVQCSYDSTACNETEFRRFYSSRYGNCFTFNTMLVDKSPKTLLTQKYGPDSGLQLTLNVKANEYVGFLAEDYGVKVAVHSPWQYPDLLGQGFTATVGFKTQAAVRKHIFYRKEDPYETKCEAEVKKEYQSVHYTPLLALHTIRECEKACFSKHLYDCCGCRFIDGAYPRHMVMDGVAKPFSILNSTHVECRENVTKRMLVSDTQHDKITCGCTESCKEEQFTHSLYFSNWPTKALQGLLAANRNDSRYISNFKTWENKAVESLDYDDETYSPEQNLESKILKYSTKNLVRLHIYYENLVETVSKEYPETTFNQIFADIGGTMGVYLGVSIMTFLEILQFFCLFGWTKMGRGTTDEQAKEEVEA